MPATRAVPSRTNTTCSKSGFTATWVFTSRLATNCAPTRCENVVAGEQVPVRQPRKTVIVKPSDPIKGSSAWCSKAGWVNRLSCGNATHS